jgi:hypothetical protein
MLVCCTHSYVAIQLNPTRIRILYCLHYRYVTDYYYYYYYYYYYCFCCSLFNDNFIVLRTACIVYYIGHIIIATENYTRKLIALIFLPFTYFNGKQSSGNIQLLGLKKIKYRLKVKIN